MATYTALIFVAPVTCWVASICLSLCVAIMHIATFTYMSTFIIILKQLNLTIYYCIHVANYSTVIYGLFVVSIHQSLKKNYNETFGKYTL